MRRYCVSLIVPIACSLASVNAHAQLYTECFTEQAMQQPAPVVAGLTRTVLVAPPNDQILSESLFDASGNDPWSFGVNEFAGATSCDRNPDVRAMWSYIMSDDISQNQAIMTLTVTAYSAQTANPPSGATCAVATNAQVRVVQVDTGPLDSYRWSYAGSLDFAWDLTGCDANHDWFQARIRAVAQTSLGGSVTDEGCFVVPFRQTPSPCPAGTPGSCL